MLDAYNNQNVKVNAVSGSILKNHPKSWFRAFHINSPLAKELMAEGGRIVILQMMLCGDNYVVAECVRRNDLDFQEEKA